jgi:uncharacterized membrane protein YccC
VALLRHALMPRSGAPAVVARAGVAVMLAGFCAMALGVDRAYWAMAAAVLVLHQGLDRARTVQRAVARTVGTVGGLLLAGLVLTVHPTGLWLALLIAVLQFTIEMLVLTNYALAVVFITAIALTISSGGQPVHDVAGVVLARGVDTLIGCAVATAVYLATASDRRARRLRARVASTLDAITATAPYLNPAEVASTQARVARRDLQLRAIGMLTAYEEAVAGSDAQKQTAEGLWPTVAATEQLVYRTLAACWALQHGDEQAQAVAADDEVRALRRALAATGPTR